MQRIRLSTRPKLHKPDYSSGIRRLLAILIDVTPVFVVVLILTPRSQSQTGNGATDISLELLIAFLIMTPILTLLEAMTGRTVGKFLLGIRVVDQNGDIPTPKTALIRNLVRIYDSVFAASLLLPLILFDILVRKSLPGWLSGAYRHFWSETGQRWGDELAGTYVIRGPWNPVRVGRFAPASSNRDSTKRRSRSSDDGSPSIRLSGRRPKK